MKCFLCAGQAEGYPLVACGYGTLWTKSRPDDADAGPGCGWSLDICRTCVYALERRLLTPSELERILTRGRTHKRKCEQAEAK